MAMNSARTSIPEQTLLKKFISWLYRYAPAEIGGTIGALVAAGGTAYWGGNALLVAVAGAWGEAFGFYIPLVVREFTTTSQERPLLAAIVCTVRNLLLEFGMAEVLDTTLLRPGLMALAVHAFAPISLAIVTGKIAADIVFYGFVICGYELRQRLDLRP